MGTTSVSNGTNWPDLPEAILRRWLTQLKRPDQLATPEMVELLRAHGKLPENQTSIGIGQAGSELLLSAIERLRPPEGSGRDRELPHLVLKTCFIDGAKLFQAAARLGMSERQMSRERARAVGLLRAELETTTATRVYRPEPIPTIGGFLPRPLQMQGLKGTLDAYHVANVHGPPGVGKTSLVAELAAETASDHSVIWYRFRSGVNASLSAVLYEIGEYLYSAGHPELSNYIEEMLPLPDSALATRLALKGLAIHSVLIVFDDYHVAEDDPEIVGLIDELVSRLPDARVVTIGRHRIEGPNARTSIELGPLTRTETRELFELLGVEVKVGLARTLHTWTGGNVHLTKLAASWLKTANPDEVARGVGLFSVQEEVQSFLLSNITELLDSDDKAILEAASVFHDRFSDDALAYVSGRTRGAILDAGRRLVRAYVATRSKEGDTAFFHASVRDYVYERLDLSRRVELHMRAAEWYRRKKMDEEADHQEQLGSRAEAEVDLNATLASR